MIDIDKINESMLMGLVDSRVFNENQIAWDEISKISNNHNIGTRTDVFNMIIDDMYKKALAEKLF